MTFRLLSRALAVSLLVLCFAAALSADVRLPAVFTDHMVLERDMPVPVWGWAAAGEKVTVSLAGQTKTATACDAGKWSVKFDAIPAGGPYLLKVQGQNAVEVRDVLVGEVWLCSGQSNMDMRVHSVMNAGAEIAAAKYPQIRMFATARKTAEEPQADCRGQWLVCSPKTAGGFTAAGYFFGRELHKKLGVPVGLIDSSWGGTPIQGWTGVKAQEAVPELRHFVDNMRSALASYHPQTAQLKYQEHLAQWEQAVAKAKSQAERERLARNKPRPADNPHLSPWSPGRLFNGMIAPLAPYAIRGAIWYQGESNAGQSTYSLHLRTMITEWRTLWNEGEFPFLFVQLPNFMSPQKQPSETSGWPLVREQFLKTLVLPNTGMAVTIDVGDPVDIHPKNKQEVGRRLAQWALAKTYGKDVVACGPLYKAMHSDGGKIVIEFDYAAGLAARGGGKLEGFAIAGADKKFIWADAQVVGQTVVVSSPAVTSPVAVRYAWANNPDCNLVNGAGLPASPFRTDEWNQ
jgi:sialate O-acetylesterase